MIQSANRASNLGVSPPSSTRQRGSSPTSSLRSTTSLNHRPPPPLRSLSNSRFGDSPILHLRLPTLPIRPHLLASPKHKPEPRIRSRQVRPQRPRIGCIQRRCGKDSRQRPGHERRSAREEASRRQRQSCRRGQRNRDERCA